MDTRYIFSLDVNEQLILVIQNTHEVKQRACPHLQRHLVSVTRPVRMVSKQYDTIWLLMLLQKLCPRSLSIYWLARHIKYKVGWLPRIGSVFEWLEKLKKKFPNDTCLPFKPGIFASGDMRSSSLKKHLKTLLTSLCFQNYTMALRCGISRKEHPPKTNY